MNEIKGRLVRGHQIASGKSPDKLYPKGSLEMQMPFFLQGGLDLSVYYRGTLNIDIGKSYILSQSNYTFLNIKWAENCQAESFSFYECSVSYRDNLYDGYVYYVHPETKAGHFQKNSVIEIITHHIKNIDYGDELRLHVAPEQFS